MNRRFVSFLAILMMLEINTNFAAAQEIENNMLGSVKVELTPLILKKLIFAYEDFSKKGYKIDCYTIYVRSQKDANYIDFVPSVKTIKIDEKKTRVVWNRKKCGDELTYEFTLNWKFIRTKSGR